MELPEMTNKMESLLDTVISTKNTISLEFIQNDLGAGIIKKLSVTCEKM